MLRFRPMPPTRYATGSLATLGKRANPAAHPDARVGAVLRMCSWARAGGCER